MVLREDFWKGGRGGGTVDEEEGCGWVSGPLGSSKAAQEGVSLHSAAAADKEDGDVLVLSGRSAPSRRIPGHGVDRRRLDGRLFNLDQRDAATQDRPTDSNYSSQ